VDISIEQRVDAKQAGRPSSALARIDFVIQERDRGRAATIDPTTIGFHVCGATRTQPTMTETIIKNSREHARPLADRRYMTAKLIIDATLPMLPAVLDAAGPWPQRYGSSHRQVFSSKAKK